MEKKPTSSRRRRSQVVGRDGSQAIRRPEHRTPMRAVCKAIQAEFKNNPLLAGALAATVGAAMVIAGAMHLKADILRQLLASKVKAALGPFGLVAGAMLALLGGAGLAIAGTAFSIPAAIVGAIGAWAGADLASAAGGLVKQFMEPSLSDWILDGSLLGLGLALLVIGVKQMMRDQRVVQLVAQVKSRVKKLAEDDPVLRACGWLMLPAFMGSRS